MIGIISKCDPRVVNVWQSKQHQTALAFDPLKLFLKFTLISHPRPYGYAIFARRSLETHSVSLSGTWLT
jgi:hypothetical protein